MEKHALSLSLLSPNEKEKKGEKAAQTRWGPFSSMVLACVSRVPGEKESEGPRSLGPVSESREFLCLLDF